MSSAARSTVKGYLIHRGRVLAQHLLELRPGLSVLDAVVGAILDVRRKFAAPPVLSQVLQIRDLSAGIGRQVERKPEDVAGISLIQRGEIVHHSRKISTSDRKVTELKANRDRLQTLVDELEQKVAAAQQGGGERITWRGTKSRERCRRAKRVVVFEEQRSAWYAKAA